MNIRNCSKEDIEQIFFLYHEASSFQKSKKTVVVWPEFTRDLVETEINENRIWKLTLNGQIACVWSTTFSDFEIWEERNKDRAIYIHRIATHPRYRGKNFVKKIVEWAKEYGLANKRQYVRLDTLGNNVKLIEHYKNAGFTFLGMFKLNNTNSLPSHYHGNPACLFQIELNSK